MGLGAVVAEPVDLVWAAWLAISAAAGEGIVVVGVEVGGVEVRIAGGGVPEGMGLWVGVNGWLRGEVVRVTHVSGGEVGED